MFLRHGILLLLSMLILPVMHAQEATVIDVQFNGHQFNLPLNIADGFSAFVMGEPTGSFNEPDTLIPPRTEFRLLRYSDSLESSAPVGWVSVYQVSDMNGYAHYEQYQHLRDVLDERPDLSLLETLPTVYPYQASALPPDYYSEFFVNTSYLESDGYHGITFIYGRVIQVGSSRPVVFYRVYFEGISADNMRYISEQVEGSPRFMDALEEITDSEAYLIAVQELLDAPVDDAIIAWIAAANEMFISFDYEEIA
jgi:hypothetical protein